MKPSERITEITQDLIHVHQAEINAVPTVEGRALVIFGWQIQGMLDYFDEVHQYEQDMIKKYDEIN